MTELLTASVIHTTPTRIQAQLRPFAQDPLAFSWAALSPEAKLAVIAGASTVRSRRILRNIVLAAVSTYLQRQGGSEDIDCLRRAHTTAASAEPVSFPMFTDLTAKARAVFDVIAFANATKTPDYGRRLATYVDAAVSHDGTLVADVVAALKAYPFARVRKALTASMPSLDTSLMAHIPEGVRTKLMALGDIGAGMLSLSDDEAVSVILSRPVVDLNRQKFLEAGLAAWKAAVIVFPFPETQELAAMSVQTLSTTDAISVMMRAQARPFDPASATVDEDKKELTDLDYVSHVLSAVMAKPAMGEDVRAAVEHALASLESARGFDFAARFRRALRSQYPTDVIASAFLPHNVGVNTEAVDVERVQQFLSRNNLGALASTFMHYRTISGAWQNMPIRGYLEVLKWPAFAETAKALPGAPAQNLRRQMVLLLAETNAQVLNEVMVAPTGTTTTALVQHLVTTPMTTEFRLSDFMHRDPDAREFARKLTELANTARREPEVTDYFIASFGDIITSPFGVKAIPNLRELCEALMPETESTAAISAQLLGSAEA